VTEEEAVALVNTVSSRRGQRSKEGVGGVWTIADHPGTLERRLRAISDGR